MIQERPHGCKVNDAYQAHAAILRAEADDPKLRKNEYWQALKEAAYARFIVLYEAKV